MGPRRRRILPAAVVTLISCSCREIMSFVPCPAATSAPRANPSQRHNTRGSSVVARRSWGKKTTQVMAVASKGFRRGSGSSSLLYMTTTDTGEGTSSSSSIDSTASSSAVDASSTTSSAAGLGGAGDSTAVVAAAVQEEPVSSSGGAGSSEADETAVSLDMALEEGVNRALRGDTAVLRQVVAEGAEWRGPLGQNVGLAAIEEELRGIGKLLTDPRMSVFSSKDGAKTLEWIASGTWPLPWLPRFIVKGASKIKTGADGKVVEIIDTWEGNLLSLAFKHLVPGFWDIWHQLGSPPAEKQPYKVLKNARGYQIREYAPRLVLKPSVIDRSNSRELRMTLILPGFCHTGELRTSGRKPDEYYVTAPLEVAVEPFIEVGNFPNGTWFNGTRREASTSRRANRITWTVPVPTAFGLDVTALPPAEKEVDREEGQMARHAGQGFRRIAVANFNGLPQDPEAAQVRAKLISQLTADGVTPSRGKDGRLRNGILMHNSRACFNKRGELAMSILYYRPRYIGIGNEVFVELDDDPGEDGGLDTIGGGVGVGVDPGAGDVAEGG